MTVTELKYGLRVEENIFFYFSGLGLFIGVEIVANKEQKLPGKEFADQIYRRQV